MTRLLAILLLLPAIASAAGLGVYNPAQHAVNGFMPTQLPGLVAWYQADIIGQTNGGTITNWPDFSGKALNAGITTGSRQPQMSSFNGRSTVVFDGVDDCLEARGFKEEQFSTNHYAIFAVAKKSANAANIEQCIFYLGNHENYTPNYNWRGIAFYSNPNTSEKLLLANYSNPTESSASGTTVLNTNQFYVISGTVAQVGGTNVVYLNAKQDGTKTNALYPSINTNAYALIGTRVAGSVGRLNGSISEIIIFSKLLSDQHISSVHRYLGTKYGIVVQ